MNQKFNKLFGSSWRTSIVGWIMLGYGISDMLFQKTITEFGFLSVTMGTGFIKAKDDAPTKSN